MREHTIPIICCLISYFLLFSRFRLATGISSQEDCSCGQLHNISWPFGLISGSTSRCGNPQPFQLLCIGNKTYLEIHSSKYYVTEISSEMFNPYIKLQYADLPRANCPLPSQTLSNKTLDAYYKMLGVYGQYSILGIFFSPYFITPSWVSFVNCTSEITHQIYVPLPCLRGKSMFVYAVYDPGYYAGAYQLRFLQPSCHFLAMHPTYYNATMPRSQEDVFQLLQNGFALYWKYRIVISFAQTLKVLRPIVQGLILLAILAILMRFIFAPISVCIFLAHKFYTMRASVDTVEKFLLSHQTLECTRFSYTDLIAMTGHFREKLGQGGFGSVFKGNIVGRLVAIKMLGNSRCDGDEFISEVSTIGRIHHVNVVQLVGFCSEGSKRALVYEYMPNGSLDKYIFSSNKSAVRPFTDEKLNEIALSVARGIDYLHRGCDMRILHFDIKPHNILLDHNFKPKLSDFGLAKLYPKDYSMMSFSTARGTIGYIAPELISRSFGVISYKSDVYSFGMLLMEMAGRRRNVNPQAENSSQVYYPSWIYDQLSKAEVPESDDIINVEIGEVERKLCKVGLWCIQMKPSDRPSMAKVIEMLQSNENDLQMPPKPFFSSGETTMVPLSYLDSCPTELSTISEDE